MKCVIQFQFKKADDPTQDQFIIYYSFDDMVTDWPYLSFLKRFFVSRSSMASLHFAISFNTLESYTLDVQVN